MHSNIVELSGASALPPNELDYPAVVLLHASWCGHCVTFAPVFREAADSIKRHCPKVHVYMIECSNVRPEVKAQYALAGFPTLYVFTKDGQKVLYQGKRTKGEVTSFVTNLLM